MSIKPFSSFSRVLFPLINPITATRLTTIIRHRKTNMTICRDVSVVLRDDVAILELIASVIRLRIIEVRINMVSVRVF